MIAGSHRSSPVIAVFGYMISGKSHRKLLAATLAISASAIASHTTFTCGRSVEDSACASPRFSPSVATSAASSTTTTAMAKRPTRSGP